MNRSRGTSPTVPSDPLGEAERAFAQFLRELEADSSADFDAFCRARPALAQRLRELHRDWTGVGAALGVLAVAPRGGTSAEELPDTLARLAAPRRSIERYRIIDEIARGGMGCVLRVWDKHLRRQVAMKVVLDPMLAGTGAGAEKETRTRRIARFLEEAQITGQLDHPGIVPVHEMGVDGEGRAFFTLKLVRGRELREVFELVREGQEGWNQTRALGALLRVCEAMAFAHEHGVVHRDLKPSNVMVGRHGETYVMDWGLARLTGDEDDPATAGDTDALDWDGVLSERHGPGKDSPGSPLRTVDGEVLGTPQYMSPEQARGELDSVGPPSDVYSVGAMLYELLAGRPPYARKPLEASPQVVLHGILEGPPPPLARIAPRQPAEIVAICEKAMARRITDRYADMAGMAEDLRAFLENRVVRAWRTGALVELRKWIERNPLVAGLSGLVIALAVVAGFLWAWQEQARLRERMDRLARAYVEEGERSWPVHPDSIPAMRSWLEGARRLLRDKPRIERELAALRRDGWPLQLGENEEPLERQRLRTALSNERLAVEELPKVMDQARETLAAGIAPLEELVEAEHRLAVSELELAEAERRAAELELRLRQGEPWGFETPELTARHARLAELGANLENLSHPEFGLVGAVAGRIEEAASLRRRSLEEAREAWVSAIASIADTAQCPLYHGLTIRPQLGLVPLRRHPESGLWEFWHVASGDAPRLETGDEWSLAAETGLVFVLVPGGRFWMGAQGVDPGAPHYDSQPYRVAMTIHEADIAPYFLSKYELSQAQWARLCGRWPSTFAAGHLGDSSPQYSRMHPVETVSWEECRTELRNWGLDLPTEARWERAARCGFDRPYGPWGSFAELPQELNAADEAFRAETSFAPGFLPGRNDGWPVHAPVDRTALNPWGFFGMMGNVTEWVLDGTDNKGEGYGRYPDQPPDLAPETGEHRVSYRSMDIHRGGSFLFYSEPLFRPSERFIVERNTRRSHIGVRPVRSLEPPLAPTR